MKPFDKEAFMNGAIALTRRQLEARYIGELRNTERLHVVAINFKVGDGHFEESVAQFDEDFCHISRSVHRLTSWP